MPKLEVSMSYKKSTPGTVVYSSDNKEDFIRQLYIEKESFDGIDIPKKIKLSVDWS